MALVVENLFANAGNTRDASLTPGSRRFPGGRNGYLLQYSCLEESHGQRSLAGYSPWHRVPLDMTKLLGTHTCCMLLLTIIILLISVTLLPCSKAVIPAPAFLSPDPKLFLHHFTSFLWLSSSTTRNHHSSPSGDPFSTFLHWGLFMPICNSVYVCWSHLLGCHLSEDRAGALYIPVFKPLIYSPH